MKPKNNIRSALTRSFASAIALFASSLALAPDVRADPLGDFIEKQMKNLNEPHAVPNLLLGDVDENSSQFFASELEQIKKKVGKGTPAKGPFIYVRIKSRGGDVEEGEKILRMLNTSLDEGYQVRIVCEEASSIAAVILSSFKGKRFATKKCSGLFHGSYLAQKNPDSSFENVRKSGDPRLSDDEQFTLDDTNNGFAALLSRRSCRIDHALASAFFTAHDIPFKVEDLMELDIIDHVVSVTKGGFYHVERSFDQYKKPCTEKYKTESRLSADGYVKQIETEDENAPKLLEPPRPASPSRPSGPHPQDHRRK
ncbi:MAG: ATP-dependent Clp protease proteolytic subunit [Alphaproteobacteria bacterium]|nr:ATP-dependent Clp protease proteolytic subunit [Alphaproteobacteria bacterium]